MLEQEEVDEVTRYIDVCYISAHEATWQIFNFWMHAEVPPVKWLSVHLENQQTIFFDPQDDIAKEVQQ